MNNHGAHPKLIHLIGGNVSSFTGPAVFFLRIPPNIIVHGDKGYYSENTIPASIGADMLHGENWTILDRQFGHEPAMRLCR